MPKFDDYTQKSTPEDTDLMLLLDKTENANKKVLFSGIWNWIVKKLAEAVIEKLQTSDKTIIGALNELNSNSFKCFDLSKTINADTDWNDVTEPGIYKVQCSPNFVEGKNAPMIGSNQDFYSFGILLVFAPIDPSEHRFVQIYIPDTDNVSPYRMRLALRTRNLSNLRPWLVINLENTL